MNKPLTIEEFKVLSKEEQAIHLKAAEDIKAQGKIIDDDTKNMKQLSMNEFKSVITDTIKDQMSHMTKVDKKYNVLPGVGNDPAVTDDTSEAGQFRKTAKFLSALVGRDLKTAKDISLEAAKKAHLSESVATEGGFLVPEEFKNEILRLAPLYGIARGSARIIPMSKDIMNIPAAGTTDQSAIWIQEAKTIKQTDPNFKQVQLVVSKLGALPKLSNEEIADASPDIIAYLAQLIAEAFAKEEDATAFLGGATRPFIGMLEATGAPSQANASGTISALSYPDLVNFTQHMYSNVLTNAKYYFHRTIITHIKSLITTTGAPIFGGSPSSILGFPMVGVEILPSIVSMGASSGSAFGIFGDIRRGYAFGDRQAMSMKLSTEATVDGDNLFEQDMTALRMIERIAMAVLLPSAFTILKTV